MNGPLRYYTPGQVALACFLGSPLAGCWLMSRTYRAAGEKKKETAAIICGFVGTAVLIGIGELLPENFPNAPLPLATTVGLFHCAKHLQRETIARCEAAGGTKGSWWTTAGVGLLGLVILSAGIAAVIFSFPRE